MAEWRPDDWAKFEDEDFVGIYEDGASAMLVALLGYLDEPCGEHIAVDEYNEGVNLDELTGYYKEGWAFYLHRKDCPSCMAELRGEK